uniref:Uncharacterized protein n=1 Tax=Caenorhabditis japonica TaxID=281687 RepID=A0A8R1E597_CAEJA
FFVNEISLLKSLSKRVSHEKRTVVAVQRIDVKNVGDKLL